jgi:hypothetical protein
MWFSRHVTRAALTPRVTFAPTPHVRRRHSPHVYPPLRRRPPSRHKTKNSVSKQVSSPAIQHHAAANPPPPPPLHPLLLQSVPTCSRHKQLSNLSPHHSRCITTQPFQANGKSSDALAQQVRKDEEYRAAAERVRTPPPPFLPPPVHKSCPNPLGFVCFICPASRLQMQFHLPSSRSVSSY